MDGQKDYLAFRREYEQQHPNSIPTEDSFMGEYPGWVTVAVGAMFVTAAFFSGVHTVPIAHDAIDGSKVAEWLRQLGGISAFVFVESGVLISAYMLVKRFALVMFGILLLTITVAMGANLYSVAQALQSTMTDDFTKVITVFFGIVAPLMAALSGGVFVWLHQSDRTADARMQSRYKERAVAWDKEILREYKKAVAEQPKYIPAPPPAPALPAPKPKLEPVKVKVGNKTMYRCPACQRQMTRQAWSSHKCRQVDTSVDRQLTGQEAIADQLSASNDTSSVEFSTNGHSKGGA